MSYLSNNTRVVSLVIGNKDYTANLIEWSVSDASANDNGCIITSGELTLGSLTEEGSLEDYRRRDFSRGNAVFLDLREGDGDVFRHPRGLLFVGGSSYDIESETVKISLLCKLGMMKLVDDDDEIDELRALIPIELDAAQDTFEGCCGSFAAVGKYVYQDNQGTLQVNEFFDGDTLSTASPGEWISILGTTASSVSPLVGAEAIPEVLEISYSYSADGVAEDQRGEVKIETTTSYYFFAYPVVNFERQNSDADEDNPNGTLDNIGSVVSNQPTYGATSSCGNTPNRPDGDGDGGTSCNEGYSLVQSPYYVPAIRTTVNTTTYDGPGGQVSTIEEIVKGPRIEASPQYFADSFAYCRQVWGSECEPNGACPYDGMDEVVLSKTVTTNFFGDANEVVRQFREDYVTELSAAQPTDWRAGNVGGQISEFDQDFGDKTDLFRRRVSETLYGEENGRNVQTQTTYTSIVSRGGGINGGQDIDALSGIVTREVRESVTLTALGVQPDILNSPVTNTNESVYTVNLRHPLPSDGGTTFGPYVDKTQLPVPLLFDTAAEVNAAIEAYADCRERFTKGETYGLQIGEGLRSDVVNNWRPGMPFRYYDPQKNVVMAMRMDATSWGVSTDESAFVTEGVWIGYSNGSVSMPSNVVGNSSPDMDAASNGMNPHGNGGNTNPGSPTPPPSPILADIDGETYVDSGPVVLSIDVHMGFSAILDTATPDGTQPGLPDFGSVLVRRSMTAWVAGMIVSPGDLLTPLPSGSIPVSYYGSVVVADATIVDGDLFSE